MKITTKMEDGEIVICSKCHWSGAIEDAHWMDQFVEYGYCPKCGSSEFEDLETWEKEYCCDEVETGELEFFGHKYKVTGWKAMAVVYGLIAVSACLIAAIVIPWAVGVTKIISWLFF